jgi:hypothetical protein
MRARTFAFVGLGCCLSFPALAAPAEVLNKTVTVSYTVTIPAKGPNGVVRSGSRNAIRTIYISSAGRVFGRVSRRDARGDAETKEAAPGERGNSYRFEGSKLVGVMPFVSGAAQMTITFGSGGQSCDAAITLGRDSGQALKWKGVNGAIYEAAGQASVSNVSCPIRAGNAFAE